MGSYMWLARIEIKEVTHGTESRRIILVARPHAYCYYPLLFIARVTVRVLTLSSLHRDIHTEYYREASRRVIGAKSMMRTLYPIGLPQLPNAKLKRTAGNALSPTRASSL